MTLNDAGDTDGYQNFPVLISADSTAADTTVVGTLNSTASTTFDIDVFSSAACHTSGHGPAGRFLGTFPVTTNASGNVTFSEVLSVPVPAGRVLTTTATRAGGSTSELSACRTTTGLPGVSIGDVTVTETDDDSVVAEATITLSGPADGTTEIDVETVDGTATADDDYTAVVDTVTLDPGVTSAVVQFPIVGDDTEELDEELTVELSNPVDLAIEDSVGVVTILSDELPFNVSIADLSVAEGASGVDAAELTVSLDRARLGAGLGRLGDERRDRHRPRRLPVGGWDRHVRSR